MEHYTETECRTDYKEDCEYQWEGTGYNKVWAPIPGTCRNNPYDKCGDVQKQKQKQVNFFLVLNFFCLTQIFVGPVPGLSERPQTELSESASARVSAGA